MKKNFVRMIVMMLVLICMVSMFAACDDSSSPNDPSKQKEWEVVGIHPGVRGSNGIAVEYYIVTAIDDDNGVHAVAIQPHQIEIVENGTVKLDNDTLYITIDDFVAFINSEPPVTKVTGFPFFRNGTAFLTIRVISQLEGMTPLSHRNIPKIRKVLNTLT